MSPFFSNLRARMSNRRRAFSQRLGLWWDNHRLKVITFGFILLFTGIYFSNRILITIGAGHAGVLFRPLTGGTQINRVYQEGLHVMLPWDTMNVYDLRVQQTEHKFSALTVNGLSIHITVSVRHRPKLLELALLHKNVGPDYVEKIIKPEVQAEVRDLVGHYTAEEIYTTKGEIIQRMLEDTRGQFSEKFLLMDRLLITSITLPATIQSAIEAKLTQEQAALEMSFRLAREEQEAKRKIIEAQGVQTAQRLIGQTLSEPLLKYKAIEALLGLAKSDNAKVIIMGGQAGLPFLVDTSALDSLSKSPAAAYTNSSSLTPMILKPR